MNSRPTHCDCLANGFDLAVCLRVYPKISGKPVFTFNDKLDLVRLSLQSFKQGIGDLHVKLWVILDNCPPIYRELIESLFTSCEPEFVELPGVGNEATFSKQIEILLTQAAAELVYFAEDDYLYLPGALERGVAFMQRHPQVDFITLYDHPDYYSRPIHKIRSVEIAEDGLRWRTVVSTCLTFMTRKNVLAETAHVLRTYTRKNSDLGVWLALTKLRVFNPWAFIRSFSEGIFLPASYLLAWRHAWHYLLCGKRRTLWAPQLSLATHMESRYLAPGVEWKLIFGHAGKGIKETDE